LIADTWKGSKISKLANCKNPWALWLKATLEPVGWVVAEVPVVAWIGEEGWDAVVVEVLAEVWAAEAFRPMLQAFEEPQCSG